MSDQAWTAEHRALDGQHPWPGLDSYDERAQGYFNGRQEETDELLRCVLEAPLTVLFGRSGLGKTSLLRAGLFPRLRERQALPVYVRFSMAPSAPPLMVQVLDSLRRALREERVEAAPVREGESLWEYLHRSDLELWSERNQLLLPVLVLDQFEEIFTHGDQLPGGVERLRIEFGDLAENRVPAWLAKSLGAEVAEAGQLDLRALRYRIVVSLREDFLPELEGWGREVPSLRRERLRLLPMRQKEALAAVLESGRQLMDEEVAKAIVRFVAAERTGSSAPDATGDAPASDQGPSSPPAPGADGEHASATVEPALLSLFCQGLNERRLREGKASFDRALLETTRQGIIADYYRTCISDLPESVGLFVESELISGKGFRNSFAREDAVPRHLTEGQLELLVRRRLLRVEERYGTQRIELTHDLLTWAVRENRDQRVERKKRAELLQESERKQEALRREAEHERAARIREVGKRRKLVWFCAALALALAFATLRILNGLDAGSAVDELRDEVRKVEELR